MSASIDAMTENQTDVLLQFHSVTSIDDLKRCEDILEKHNWDIEKAVQSAMAGTVHSAQFSEDESNNDESESLIGSLFDDIPSSSQTTFGPQNLSLEARDFLNTVDAPRPSIFGRILSLLKYIFRHISGNLLNVKTSLVQFILPSCREPTAVEIKTPEDDVKDFIADFTKKYDPNNKLRFINESYKAAQRKAKQEIKFLLVYLHDSNCKDIDPFCFGTLCHPDTVEFINKNVLLWGCSINKTEGNYVTEELLNEHFPFLALQCVQHGSLTVVAKTHGQVTSEELISRLREIMDLYEPNLKELREKQAIINMDRIIRQEQEEEYRKSLEIDRRKSEQLAIEKEAQRAKEAELLAQKQERQRRRGTFFARKLECGLNLPEEPSPGEPNVITLQIKFANGFRVRRRFKTTDSVQLLHDFVYSHEGTPFKLQLVTCFPKKDVPFCSTNYIDSCLGGASLPTLKDVGLDRNETLSLINSWDEEEPLSTSSSALSVVSQSS